MRAERPRARPLRAVLALAVLAAALYVGARPAGPLPPLGPLLDPARGAWGTVRAAALPREDERSIPGLTAPVRVLTDGRGVPHVFAANEDDAYRALGYVVARERLFQLELQWRAAAGRLSEIAGARAVALDSEPRRLGLPDMARRKLAALSADSGLLRAARAYADGVNAYVDGMSAAEVPVEYRLLGARPTRWEPEHALHLLNRMAWMLSFDEADLRKERVAALVGRAAADALFPLESPILEPIQPNGQTAPRVDLRPLPPPGAPDSAAQLAASLRERIMRALGEPDGNIIREVPSLLGAGAPGGALEETDAVGSNNWAVAPSRSKSGHALLAGDPHLGMSLPAIWYEAHLVVPGRLDVYGVTIPGAPAVILGFNRDVAWTFTNTDAADVIDYYDETVDDPRRPTRYRLDDAWHPLRRVVEAYRAPDGSVAHRDTVLFTHRGPLVKHDGRWLSLRWTAYEMTNEGEALLRAQKARTVDEWFAATAGWGVPAQNMLVADRAGAIGIRSTGRFPLRPGGRGDAVFDGQTRAVDWTGFVPLERLPQSIRPAQGFLASANQQNVDPRANDAYIGFGWLDPWRAMRINEILRADSLVTPETMRQMQTDPGSPRADRFVPILVAAAARPGAPSEAREAARLLGEWDRRYTRENRRAVLFEYAMRELTDRTWDELAVPGAVSSAATSGADREGAVRRVATPSAMALLQLVADSASPWWDDRRTPAVESRDAVLWASLSAALARARRELGEPSASDSGWAWERHRFASIGHLLELRGFSMPRVPVQGGPSTLSPSSGNGRHGASWRMVVELGPEVRAWSIYPGGQSGHPASPRYADRIPKWAAGELDSVRIPRVAADLAPEDVLSTLTLTPVRR